MLHDIAVARVADGHEAEALIDLERAETIVTEPLWVEHDVDALASLARSLALRTKAYGPDDPLVAESLLRTA